MTFFQESGNSYSYFDDAETSKGGYDFSEGRSRPYDFEMLPPQNLDEYLIESFSGSFGLDSVASDTSDAEYDTLAIVSRKPMNSSGSYGQHKKSADSKSSRNPSTPGNAAYDTPAAYFSDYLGVSSPTRARTTKKNSTPVKKANTPAASNSTAPTPATAASGSDKTSDFNFGMQAFLHSQQLGFGRQPSFRRVGTEDAQTAHSVQRRNDYFFGFDDKPFGAASTRPGQSSRRASNASRGQATPASVPPEYDVYKKWMDTLESSGTNRLDASTLTRSTRSGSKPLATPKATDGTLITAEFKREVDFLMRGILGDIEVTPSTQSDARATAPNHMWANLDSFLSGSVTLASQRPSVKSATKGPSPSPATQSRPIASTNVVASAPAPVRTRPRPSDAEPTVATVHYAFPASATTRKVSAPKETTVEDYFVDPSWINGETTPMSRSASAMDGHPVSRQASQTTNGSSNRLSIHTEDSGPAPSAEPTMPGKGAKQSWKRIPKPQVTASTSKLVVASIPNNGLGTLQRSPTKESTQPASSKKRPAPPTTGAQPLQSVSVPVKRSSLTSAGKTPRTPGDPLNNMEYPSAEGLRASGMDVKVGQMPFFPSSSTDALNLKSKPKDGTTAKPPGILSRPSTTTPVPQLQTRRASIRNERGDPDPQSQPLRRRLSEFKSAAGDTAMATSFSVSRTEDVAAQRALALERQKAAQKANEERKERVQAFLARRKKEKQEAEQERVRQKATRDAEQARAAASATRRSQGNATPPAGSAANAVRGKLQRTSAVKTEPSRQSVPAAPYLQGDGFLHTSGVDEPAHPTDSAAAVRSVLVNVAPGTRSSVTLVAKDASTVEVRLQRESPRFFNVNEYLDYDQSNGQNLSSVTLSETVRKFLAGTNTALLLSSSPNAERAAEAAVSEVVSALVRHRPTTSQMYMSTAVLYGGMTADLLAPAGTALTQSAFVHAPTFGSVVDNVGYQTVQSARDVSKTVTDGFEKAAQARKQNRNALFVVTFILKQIKDKDVILSSLTLTDAPAGVYAQVLRKLEASPYPLFHGILGGPTFTVAMFAVTVADADLVQTLNTHHKLASIANKPTRLGSVSAFKRLAEKELHEASTQPTSTSSRSLRRPQLRHWLDEADKALANPTTYTPRPLVGTSTTTTTGTTGTTAGKRGSTSAAPAPPVRPVSKPRPVAAPAVTEASVSLTKHNSASVMSPKVSGQRLSSEAYINRGASTAPNYGQTGFINLDEHVPVSQANSRRTSGQKTLPGATTVNANGPAWPAQQPLKGSVLVPTRSATEEAILTVASMSGSSFSSSTASGMDLRASTGRRRVASEAVLTIGSTDDDEAAPPSATRVRTMVVVDPQCKESSNVTFENKMVIATTEDDFEEYDVDEVLEMNLTSKDIKSKVLNELCDTVLSGCNAALLGGDSRSYAASPQVLKIAVRRILSGISKRDATRYGILSVSIVRVRGKTMTDLLVPGSEPKKLVVAISPIFGSCVHGVEFRQIDNAVTFDVMLKKALDAVVSKNERDVGFICCSFILKLKLEDEKDVLVSSLVACFAGENVGLYTSVLDQSPLVPRALFHYALGGPCFTVSLLGIGGDEARANLMLQVQRSLGQTNNRITHPGSISKFVGGIRNELAPAMMQKLKHGESESERAKTKEILARLTEIVKDAEALLRDFDNHEPKAYLNSDEDKDDDESGGDTVTRGSTSSTTAPTGRAPPQGRRSLPNLVVKGDAGSRGSGSGESDDTRVHALVCLEERMMGGGSVTVSDGTAVLVKTRHGGMRFDADEVVTRSSTNTSLDSTLIDNLVNRFLRGHHTGLVTADSSNCAFTPLMLRKIVYQVVGLMQTGLTTTSGQEPIPITGELRVSMALIKDGLIADLLPIEEDAQVQPFSVQYNPIAGPVLGDVLGHLVPSAEQFDRFLAVAIDNADPSLQSADPGIMVVSLALTQRVTRPKEDVLVSSLLCTAVFDAVQHYTAVLNENAEEPLDLFRFILGGPSYTVALTGICDEDEDPNVLLNVLSSLSAVRNRPSHPNSVAKYIADLQQSIVKLHEVMSKSSNPEEKNYIKSRLELAETMLREAETVLRYPLSYMNVQQQNQLTFVPLGATMAR